MDKIRDAAQELSRKCIRMFGEKSILEFKIAADKVREREKHTDYEIKAHLVTTEGDFHASKTGWEVLTVVDEVLAEMERQVVEKKEKVKRHRQLPDNA